MSPRLCRNCSSRHLGFTFFLLFCKSPIQRVRKVKSFPEFSIEFFIEMMGTPSAKSKFRENKGFHHDCLCIHRCRDDLLRFPAISPVSAAVFEHAIVSKGIKYGIHVCFCCFLSHKCFCNLQRWRPISTTF